MHGVFDAILRRTRTRVCRGDGIVLVTLNVVLNGRNHRLRCGRRACCTDSGFARVLILWQLMRRRVLGIGREGKQLVDLHLDTPVLGGEIEGAVDVAD
jgi:hypothetical protein